MGIVLYIYCTTVLNYSRGGWGVTKGVIQFFILYIVCGSLSIVCVKKWQQNSNKQESW